MNAMKLILNKHNLTGMLLIVAALVLSQFSCKPLTEKEKPTSGLPVDCTYSLPNLAQINQFILNSPNDGKLYRIRSQILLDSGRYNEALSDAKKALSINPEDNFNFVVVGKAHRALGQIDSALMACNTAEQNGFNDPDNYLLMGDLYLIIREYKKSLDYLNKALKLAPFEPRIYYLKGMVFWETKDTVKALSNWQTSIEQDANYADGYTRLAIHYMKMKQYNVAEQFLRSGLRLRPDDAFLNYDMGVFLNYRHFPDSAVPFYEKAIQLDPKLGAAKLNLGLIRFNKGAFAEAVPLLEPVSVEDPKNSTVSYFLGLAYRNTGNLAGAETQLKRTVDLNRDYAKEAAASLEKVRKQLLKQKADSALLKN
jgi:tetratricopeptide (TPR) repeat protein